MPEPSEKAELGSPLLLQNARWFTQVRWFVTAVFLLAGLAGRLFPGTLQALGLVVPFGWLWALAGVLGGANVVFVAVARSLPKDSPRSAVKALLWSQIALDLLVVTLLVHAIGGTRSFISFVYLFHITLACIFFAKRESLLVTLAASVLSLLSLSGELAGVWPPRAVVPAAGASSSPVSLSPALFVAGSAVFIWWVVWYLVSTLSEAVRRRDLQLSDANDALARLGKEQNRHMLMTVHELKVPFAEIESHIDTLKLRYAADIPPAVSDILGKIDRRAGLLSERIGEILLLGNLKSGEAPQEPLGPVDVAPLIDTVLRDLDQKARERSVQFDTRVPPIVLPGNPEQLEMLFRNLVSNAILYSPEGGRVEIAAREEAAEVRVLVTDYGIGIRDEALPHIFDEFFRTKEGARFNRMSTGLGLAIVKEIARHYGFRIRVTSEQGKGTSFEVIMPKPAAAG